MGGAQSVQMPKTTLPKQSNEDSLDNIVKFLYPVYYIHADLTPEESIKLTASWKMIINNDSKAFERAKSQDPKCSEYGSLTEYFAIRFFSRFVEVNPISAPMFSKSSEKQGRLFMNMITLIINATAEGDFGKITRSLTAITKSHNPMGIRAVEYSVFGEALFWTLKLILGEVYDKVTHRAWLIFFSKMLEVIIPNAVKYEMENSPAPNSIAEKRWTAFMTNSSTSQKIISDDGIPSTTRSSSAHSSHMQN